MMQTWLAWSNDLLGLFYPRLCLACGEPGQPHGVKICMSCQINLPYTGQFRERENAFTDRFWGRLALESGAAMLHYVKAGRVQQLIHQLKYGQQPEIGEYLGQIFGESLRQVPWFAGIDLILPLPLHPQRLHQRGYNQSAHIAAGLAATMGVSWRDDLLLRRRVMATQTRKNRWERMENVAAGFAVRQEDLLANRHVLLVDDVMTTGATLEACAEPLLAIPGLRLSMATLAMAAG